MRLGAGVEGDETIDRVPPDPARPRGLDGLSSTELMERARGGDDRALDRLFARYLPILRRWAAGRLPRWARDLLDTDDMIQETLIKTVRNVETFAPRHDGALAAYLRQALHNRIRDEVRNASRRPRREEIPEDRADETASPLEAAIGEEASRKYEEALARLSEEEREVVLARIELGLGYEEIARATNRPSADAARMAVRRALVRLATAMERE